MRGKCKWAEGPVHLTDERFELLYGKSSRLYRDDKQVVYVNDVTGNVGLEIVALVARGSENTFRVRFVMPDNPLTHEILQQARGDLDFFLASPPPPDNPNFNPWAFAFHLADALASSFPELEWQYYPGNGDDNKTPADCHQSLSRRDSVSSS